MNFFKYLLFVAVVCIVFAMDWKSILFPSKVYLECGTDIYHQTAVCDSIHGFNKVFYEEFGEITGTDEINEKEVFYKKKYKMCPYCFSPMEIEYRNEYINQ